MFVAFASKGSAPKTSFETGNPVKVATALLAASLKASVIPVAPV